MSGTTASTNPQSSNGLSELLQEVLADVHFQLSAFATRDDFLGVIQQAFGEEYDPMALEQIRQGWQSGDFELPPVEILPSTTLQGANGAYAAANNTIYFSEEFLEANRENVGAITAVWLEEIGHSVDVQINEIDTPGDEGEFFATLLTENGITQEQLNSVQSDDTSLIQIGDKSLFVEQNFVEVFSSSNPLTASDISNLYVLEQLAQIQITTTYMLIALGLMRIAFLLLHYMT